MRDLLNRFVCLFCAAVIPLELTSANPVDTDNVSARLISEHSHVKPGSTFSVALQLDIREGWHTYWRNPGDSGQATSIKWNLPPGVTASEIQWPYPERQYVGPVANYGYHGTAMHLVDMQLASDWPVGKALSIQADAVWLVCEEECIPEKASLSIEMPTSQTHQVNSEQSLAFKKIRASLPNILSLKSGYQYITSSDDLRLEFSPDKALTSASQLEYFPFEWGFVSAPAEQQVVIDNDFVSIVTQRGEENFSRPIKGVLVATQANGDESAFEVESSLGVLNTLNNAHPSQAPGNNVSLLMALLLAMLGGVILNLMPCVFPVLFVKTLSLLSHAGDQARVNRRHGLAYTLGILCCFAILGVVLIFIKSTGQQIGWGFQLQSPLFVSVVAMVLFALGLSLSGMLEIGTSVMGLGSSLASRPGYKGSFFTGVLAVVVATPCTAPFMGPAVGFALTQSAPITLAVLLALGAGLALPYLVLSFVPAFTRFLPKPGAWMKRLQQFLAFPMYASAAWLVWVLGQQSGINGVFILLMLFILIAFIIWLWQVTRSAQGLWKIVGNVSFVLSIVVMIGVLTLQTQSKFPSPTNASPQPDALVYQAFDKDELNRLRNNGQAVFVNMTAAWCITCLANEKVALSSPELREYFSNEEITYMKGDWTNQDSTITAYLASFDRASVPLYVFYPNNVGEPKVLPQILTVATVIENIERAQIAATPTPILSTN